MFVWTVRLFRVDTSLASLQANGESNALHRIMDDDFLSRLAPGEDPQPKLPPPDPDPNIPTPAPLPNPDEPSPDVFPQIDPDSPQPSEFRG